MSERWMNGRAVNPCVCVYAELTICRRNYVQSISQLGLNGRVVGEESQEVEWCVTAAFAYLSMRKSLIT